MATETQLETEGADTALDDSAVSLRDQIDAAFEQHGGDDPPEEEARITERTRDGKGRFSKGEAEKPEESGEAPAAAPQAPPKPTQQAQQQTDQGAPAPPPNQFKAPASWKPAQREKWASVPQDVQSEIVRREGEYQRTLEEASEARRFVQAFEQITRPYEMFFRAENSSPLGAVQSLMQTAANLRVGTPQNKAQMVAEICNTYGVDIGLLDKVLTARQGGVPWNEFQAQQNPQQFRDPRLDAFLAQQERERQQRDQQDSANIRNTLEAFAEKHEFYNDVAETMALLVEHAAMKGQRVDLEKIYSQACQMDPDISNILTSRMQTRAPGNNSAAPASQAVLRAKRAASSVRGDATFSGSAVPKDDSIRSAIEAAFSAGDE